MKISEFLALPKIHESLRKTGEQRWQCLCPAHADSRTKSLCIAVGDDGRILLDCKAGCKTEAVCGALGIHVKDLFNHNGNGKLRPTRQIGCRPVYLSLEDAARRIGERIQVQDSRSVQFVKPWAYDDADGTERFVVLRFDYTDGSPDEKPDKTFRPIHREGAGYVEGDPPGLLPLYGLPILAESGLVTVHEGEKSADAARSIGLCATTSAHGSKSPDKTNWQPLAGRDVVVFPDNDGAGRRYAEKVTEILMKLRPLPKIKVVELPGLPEKGDMVEFVQQRRRDNQSDEAIRRYVETLIERTSPVTMVDEPAVAPIDPFMPFPLQALPEPVRSFVASAAKALGCDLSYVALPLLTGLASAIGNTRRIKLKRSWSEPAILWGAIIGDSGTMKSPALEIGLRPVRKRQHTAMKEYNRAMEKYEIESIKYEKDMTVWKRSKDRGDPPTKPEPPILERGWCDDTTIEALAVLLQQNWRGLLLIRDELSGWLGSFDRYGQSKGADAAKWLEVFGGRSIMVDRKTGTSKVIYVSRAAVSVIGGIQPGVLRRALGVEHRENGLAARLLLTCPPRLPKHWTEADVSVDLENELACIFEKLYSLQPMMDDEEELQPVYLPLTGAAKSEWIKFYNEHAVEQAGLAGDLAAAWSKIEGYAPRLAMISHLVRCAANDPSVEATDAIDLASMQSGISLARWFGAEARRVYVMLGESDEERDHRWLVELIQRKGGSMTVRELQRSSRSYATASEAERVLETLVAAGVGHWEDRGAGIAGGRPSRRLVLEQGVDVDRTSENAGKSGVVSASATSTPLDGDWGVIE